MKPHLDGLCFSNTEIEEMAKKLMHVGGGDGGGSGGDGGGILKKRIMKKRNKKKTIHKVIDYLLSDSYLFAPIVSPYPFHSFPSPRKDIEIRERVKDKRSLVKKIEDYLKSDCYLYAPIVAPQSFRGCVGYVKKVTMGEKLMKKKIICTSEFVEVEATVLDQPTFPSFSPPGEGMSDPKRRKIVVD